MHIHPFDTSSQPSSMSSLSGGRAGESEWENGNHIKRYVSVIKRIRERFSRTFRAGSEPD